ncbi:MAG: hypothetical protein K0Q94_2794 [Paenibacillus sp.]|jgi:uncharacterized LabA/DUF88 family protein|nr:hypothetical protein [Paenibacillus sp.]
MAPSEVLNQFEDYGATVMYGDRCALKEFLMKSSDRITSMDWLVAIAFEAFEQVVSEQLDEDIIGPEIK